jgi:hypothetical protein
MANAPDINDPAAWQWLWHLKAHGWAPQNMSPGSNTLWGLPPPAANTNRTIRPVTQVTPGPLSSQVSAADWARMFPDITGQT